MPRSILIHVLRPRVFARVFVVCALLGALCSAVLAIAAPVGLETPRTLVVRGRVFKADGSPLAGARVMAKGTAEVSALSDDSGRYSFAVGLGAPATLKRGAFKLEVRAEANGKRLTFAAGGSALAIEVSLVAGSDHVRVRSNASGATASLITVYAQEGVPTAWIEADFGGARSAGGSLDLKAVDEVAVPGLGPARTPSAQAPAATPRASAAVAPLVVKPEPAAKPVHEKPARVEKPDVARPVKSAKPAKPARVGDSWNTRDSLAAAARRVRHAADSTAHAHAEQRRLLAALAKQARGDSLDRVRRARRSEDSLATASRRAAPASVPTPASAAAPVVPIRPARHVDAAVPDSCRCRVRGTVEVAWEERPLEENLPVTVTMDESGDSAQTLELYLGAPREFRFGPLTCGDHVLRVHTAGRLRYAIAHGDSVMTVRCAGATQVRVVLVPQKR